MFSSVHHTVYFSVILFTLFAFFSVCRGASMHCIFTDGHIYIVSGLSSNMSKHGHFRTLWMFIYNRTGWATLYGYRH